MAVSVLTRPLSFVLNPTPVACTITNSGGHALITKSSHGLIDGNYVYIKSVIEDYCGFFYVDQISTNTFKIKEYASADFVSYVANDSDADYYVNTRNADEAGWHCVELPIVYKLSNTLWPANGEDTVRTISSVANSNGYCQLTLSGDLKASGSAAKLEFVKIGAASGIDVEDAVSGVYQIITHTSETSIVIDLAYSAANASELGSNTIQMYYKNYCVKVKVFSGLPSGHQFESIRPLVEVAELSLIPDSDNIVKFSVHELLKAHIKTRNNALLATLPNNIDFWTQFYITYAESYNDSDGTTLSSYTSSYTDDSTSFKGYAVNAKLPFKNVHSGSLSEYISDTKYFLTLFDTPVIFSGFPFDISFINPYESGNIELALRQQYYLNNALQDTITHNIVSTNEGVYRVFPDDPPCIYDRVDLTVMATGVEDLVNGDFATGTISGWSNTGSGNSWVYSSGGALVPMSTGDTSRRFEQDYAFYQDIEYTLDWDIITTSTSALEVFLVTAYLSNDDYTITQIIGQESFSANGTRNASDTFTPTRNYSKLYFIVTTLVP
jgi:hypothetical protein